MNLDLEKPFFLGIDGGGSKCRARLVDNYGKVLGAGISGTANPIAGLERSISSISEATNLALNDADLNGNVLKNTVVGLGLAGVNLPNLYKKIISWDHPFRELYLTSDLKVACLGAHDGMDGAVIIVGTGSCGFVTVDGREKEYGSHGFPVGDKGSGAWFGHKAVEHVLLSLDGFEPRSLLSELIMDKLECTNATCIVDHMIKAMPVKFAKLAPLVFNAATKNDEIAVEIINEGASYISEMAIKLMNYNPPRMSILGGLNKRIIPWLDRKVIDKIDQPINDAEQGAIYFARKHWKNV